MGWVGGCLSLPLKCKVGTSPQGMGAQSLGCECTLQLAFSGRGGGASRRFKAEDASRGYVPTWQFRRIELKCIRRTRSENVSWVCMPQTRAFCRLRRGAGKPRDERKLMQGSVACSVLLPLAECCKLHTLTTAAIIPKSDTYLPHGHYTDIMTECGYGH